MLTRREFAGVAGCAICAVTAELAAGTALAAESTGAAPAGSKTPGITRKMLSQIDGPSEGYHTVMMEVTVEKGVVVQRHTHPGIESSYVLKGAVDVDVQGKGTIHAKEGEGFQIPPNTPHAGGEPTKSEATLLINYIVEKDKPLATPVA